MILLSRLFSIVSTIKKTGRDSCSDQTSKDHANLDDSHFAQNQEREQTSSAADHYSESIPSLLPPQSSIPEVELDLDGEMTVVETTGVNIQNKLLEVTVISLLLNKLLQVTVRRLLLEMLK